MQFFHSREDKIGVFICLLSAVIFGFAPPAAKAVYQDGANITFVVLLSVFFRFAFLFLGSLVQGYVPFRECQNKKRIIIAGVCQALTGLGIMGGVYFMPAAIVISILFMSTLMLLFFSAWKKDIALNKTNIIFTILSIFGLVMALDVFWGEQTYPAMGYFLAILACITTFVRLYIYQSQTSTRLPVTVGAESFAVATLCLLPLLFWDYPVLPETSYGLLMALLYATSAAIGTFGMFYGIKLLGAYKFSMVMKLEPIFTALFGVWLVNEILQPTQYVGILIVIGSLLAIQLFDKQKKV